MNVPIPQARATLLAKYGFARNVGQIVTDFADPELRRLCRKAKGNVETLQNLVTEARILRGKRQSLRLTLNKLGQRYDKDYEHLDAEELDKLLRRKLEELTRQATWIAEQNQESEP